MISVAGSAFWSLRDTWVRVKGKRGKEQALGEAQKEAAKGEEALPEVKQLPPWFKDGSDAKDVRTTPSR